MTMIILMVKIPKTKRISMATRITLTKRIHLKMVQLNHSNHPKQPQKKTRITRSTTASKNNKNGKTNHKSDGKNHTASH